MFATSMKKLLSDRRGNVGIIFAFAAVPAIAFMGSAVDYGIALSAKTELQAVVDASAAAGARLPATSNQNRSEAVLRHFNAAIQGRSIKSAVPIIDATNSMVNVSAQATIPTAFMGLVGVDSIEIGAKAAARSQIQNGGVACLIALSPNSSDGLHLQGINKISSENCWAWINSANPTSINAVGASQGSAQGFCSVGGVSGPEHFSPMPFTGCDPIADPFYAKFANYHVNATCQHSNVQYNNGVHTMQPGVYCGNTVIRPQAEVTMMPGLYVFRDGYLQVQAGSSLTGDGVTLFFFGRDTSMEIRGGGNVDLKAPATGDLAGFVIVDRKLDWYDSSIRETKIQGGGRVKLEGIMYAPQWQVTVSGNGEVNQESQFFTMIADTFYMEGNGRMHIRSDAVAAGLPDLMPKIKNGPVILK
jgi:Flp pilus assembly protein TadG